MGYSTKITTRKSEDTSLMIEQGILQETTHIQRRRQLFRFFHQLSSERCRGPGQHLRWQGQQKS
jgi:hypothetical protein